MIFPDWLPVFGDKNYRGNCISEDAVHVAFCAWVMHNYPDIYEIMIHPKNEGKRTHQQVALDKKMRSIVLGASDIIIPGNPSLTMEIKLQDHTKSHWQPDQVDYLQRSMSRGSFSCVALGLDGCKAAFSAWLK